MFKEGCKREGREESGRDREGGRGERGRRNERRDTLDVTVLNRDATGLGGIHPSGECVDS